MPTVARYFRLVLTRPTDGLAVGLSEIEVRASVGGADQTTPGGAVSASSELTVNFPATQAVDNNTTESWFGDAGPISQTEWIAYDFGSPVAIAEITARLANTSTAPTQIVIQVSDDGSTWTTTDTYSGLTWGSTETKTFSVTDIGGSSGGGTVAIGKWVGGAAGQTIGSSFAAPTLLFGTEARNDGAVYGFSAATATLTLPASNLANGYLIRVSVEAENTTGNRGLVRGRVVQTSGAGTFVGPDVAAYHRDTSDDRAYLTLWAFVDSPSAGSTYQFQLMQQDGDPGGGIVRATFDVVPLWYDDIGIYSSGSTAAPAGTTPTQITGFAASVAGANMGLASSQVTLSADNATYLILGSWLFGGLGTSRTQRWAGLRVNGAFEHAAKSYNYFRQSAYEVGSVFAWMHRTGTADDTIDLATYLGDGPANYLGGAEASGATTASNAAHNLVILQLPAAAETFRSVGSTQEQISGAGPVDMTASKVADLDWSDSAAFVRASDDGMNAEVDSDLLVFGNIGGASGNVTNGLRMTSYAELTVDGVEDPTLFAGNYMRGDVSTTGTFGWSANPLGHVAVTAGQDIGLSVTQAATTQGGGGDVVVPAGWIGWGAIRLGSLVPVTASGASVQAWNGSAWISAPVRHWDGSAWQDVTAVRRWSGSAWEDM